MKNKSRRFLLSIVVSLSMVIGLWNAEMPVTVYADEKSNSIIDLEHDMSITTYVNDGIKSYLSEVPEEKGTLVYDLYKLADVVENGGSFSYVVCDEYYELKDAIADLSSAKKTYDENCFDALAQKAFDLTFGTEVGTSIEAASFASYEGLSLEKKESVAPGLYMLVARGSIEGSTVLMDVNIHNGNYQEYGTLDKKHGTYSLLDTTYFSMIPQIICVPTKVDSQGEILATNVEEGTWLYDQSIVLKMQADPAVGSIQIEKELIGYFGDAENATFIFQVDTYYPTEETLYSSEVYSLQFTGQGTKKLTIEGLPIGCVVKVSEIYSGVNYTASVYSTETIDLIVDGETVPVVHFTNTYNHRTSGGGGVTNHFSYGITEGNGSWNWEMLGDNEESANGLPIRLLQKVLQSMKNLQHS